MSDSSMEPASGPERCPLFDFARPPVSLCAKVDEDQAGVDETTKSAGQQHQMALPSETQAKVEDEGIEAMREEIWSKGSAPEDLQLEQALEEQALEEQALEEAFEQLDAAIEDVKSRLQSQGGADRADSPAAKPQAKKAKAGPKAKAKGKDSMHKYMLS